jgi:hypothetical protein
MSSFLSRQAAKEQGYFLNILRGSKKGKERAGPYHEVSPRTPFRKISRQMTQEMTQEESVSAQEFESFTRRRPLFQDITEDIARLPRPQVLIEESGIRTEEGGNRTEEGESRMEESGAHDASSVHGETGASQETVSRKRRREEDDGISN